MECLKSARKNRLEWKGILGIALAAVILGGFVFFPGPVSDHGADRLLPLTDTVRPVPVDLNTAGLEELILLKGIGETKAQAILDYRREHGPFESWEDVDRVKGISMNMIEAWEDTAVIS